MKHSAVKTFFGKLIKVKTKKEMIYNLLIVFFAATFLICSIKIGSYYWQEYKSESGNEKIIEEVLNIPSSPQDNTEFVSYAFSKSLIKADVSVTKDDRIVALSTCAYSSNDARFIVVAKLSVIEENIPD